MSVFWDFMTDLITSFAGAWTWLSSPLWSGMSPLILLTFGGITAYILVAITLWLVK